MNFTLILNYFILFYFNPFFKLIKLFIFLKIVKLLINSNLLKQFYKQWMHQILPKIILIYLLLGLKKRVQVLKFTLMEIFKVIF